MNTSRSFHISPDIVFPGSLMTLGTPSIYHSWWFWMVGILFTFSLCVLVILFYTRKRKLMAQLDLLSRQNSELRLRSLQMQMNPHFIFNSLTSLQDLILSQSTKEALIYLGMWAGVIRTNLENVLEEYVKLSDEVVFLQKYTEMEKARFKGKLNIHFTNRIIDNSIMIPPMIIQPVIENAIKHGIGTLNQGGNIYVDLLSDSKNVFISVEDDGVGRVESLKPEAYKHNGIGLGVIEKRLELLNQKFNSSDHHFEIIDLEKDGSPSGTKVLIKMLIVNGIQ